MSALEIFFGNGARFAGTIILVAVVLAYVHDIAINVIREWRRR